MALAFCRVGKKPISAGSESKCERDADRSDRFFGGIHPEISKCKLDLNYF
jgi:hypothetical protein